MDTELMRSRWQIVALLLASFPHRIESRPEYAASIPNADRVTGCSGEPWVGVGHLRSSGGGPRNNFGIDFAAAGFTWTSALCQKDSDGDGRSNGLELGDPQCLWTQGAVPQFDTGITHPGIDCSCDMNDVSTDTNNRLLTGCANFTGATTAFQDFTFGGHAVGPHTTYIKGAFAWPANFAAMVLQFEFVNEHPNVVHHMLLYRCENDVSSQFGTPGPGSSMGCTGLVMAWAVGGGPFCTPEGVGFPIEPNSHYLLEIHYDNPQDITGIVDHSGMRLHYVPSANSGLATASVVLFGASLSSLSVPPGEDAYRVTATVSASRIGQNDGHQGIPIFAVLEHMHTLGRKMWVSTANSSGIIDELSCNTAYDFDLQEARYLPAPHILLPGTDIKVDCVYDSTSRNTVTIGGDETTNEMCLAALFYVGPAAGGNLLVPDVVLNSGPGHNKTCAPEAGCSRATVISTETQVITETTQYGGSAATTESLEGSGTGSTQKSTAYRSNPTTTTITFCITFAVGLVIFEAALHAIVTKQATTSTAAMNQRVMNPEYSLPNGQGDLQAI